MDELNENNLDLPCDHEWEFQDDSFGHEYGTETIQYYVCINCGETKEIDSKEENPCEEY